MDVKLDKQSKIPVYLQIVDPASRADHVRCAAVRQRAALRRGWLK